MNPRQDAHLAGNLTQVFRPPSVASLARGQDHVGDDFGLDGIQAGVDDVAVELRILGIFRADFVEGLVVGHFERFLAFELRADRSAAPNLVAVVATQAIEQSVRRRRGLPRDRLAALLLELIDHVADFHDGLMAQADRFEGHLLGNLQRTRLDHVDRISMARDHHVQVGVFHLRLRGVDDQFAIDSADANGAQRIGRRKRGDGHGGGRGDNSQHVRIVFLVHRKHRRLNQHLVLECFGEQRTQRAVGHPHGEDFFLRRSPLTLEKPARKLAGGVELLAVVHGQRKKVDSRPGRAGDHGGQNHRFPIGHNDRTGGLLGDLARLNGERLVPNLSRYLRTTHLCLTCHFSTIQQHDSGMSFGRGRTPTIFSVSSACSFCLRCERGGCTLLVRWHRGVRSVGRR